jgi:DNA-binding response OmpR family regulator
MVNTNILIIEDNPADIALIEAYLKESGLKHALFKYESLKGGVDFLKDNPIDIVLLDLKLVDVEGFKTLRLFREQVPDIPVIVLTGFKNEIMGIQSVRAGAQDFLVKGEFDFRSLARTIRYSLQRFEAQVKLQEKAKELSQNERRNQLAHQIAHFGKWEMDIVNNAMKWDDEIFRFFGFLPQSFDPTLSDYIKYVHVEDRAKVELFFEEAIKDGVPHNIDHRIVIENTTVKHLHVKAQMNFDESTNQFALVGGVQDITKLLETPSSLPGPGKSKERLPTFDETMFDEFNFNIRTPIASMVNFLYLLEKSPLTDPQKTFITGLKSSLDDLSFALNNWFNLSTLKEEKLDIKATDIILEDSLRVMENVFSIRVENAGMKFTFRKSPNLPEVIVADQQKLSQVLYNLVETAIHLSKKDSKIILEIDSKPEADQMLMLNIRLSFESTPSEFRAMNKVLEEKLGLNEIAYRHRDFLPIAITARLVEYLDGQFETASNMTGREAVIQCKIPVKSYDGQHLVFPDSPTEPAKLLIVEDHDLHRLATKRALLSWSSLISVDIAKNGREAVQKTTQKQYDLILMDIQMPELNGIEASVKIRNNSDTPIIALTANESKQEQERCYMIGINDYLVKPVKPDVLFNRIMRQLYLRGGSGNQSLNNPA